MVGGVYDSYVTKKKGALKAPQSTALNSWRYTPFTPKRYSLASRFSRSSTLMPTCEWPPKPVPSFLSLKFLSAVW